MITFNNRIMVEPYNGEKKLKSTVSNGFATVMQKSSLIGLKVLADAKIQYGNDTLDIKAGSTVLIPEEILCTQKSYTKTFNIEGSETKFMLIGFDIIVGVK